MDVFLTPEAQRGFGRLPTLVKVRILNIFERLKKWPDVSGVKPLRGLLVGSYRMRTGDYRVQFRVQGNRIVIDKVGHRDGFYDE